MLAVADVSMAYISAPAGVGQSYHEIEYEKAHVTCAHLHRIRGWSLSNDYADM